MPLRVLFVCTENANRSQMAEAFARAHGAGVLEAASAGSRPAGRVGERTVAAMRERGIDLSCARPKGLADVGLSGWDVVVTMGCGEACPAVPGARHEDWDLPDPRDMPPEDIARVRDDIERRVTGLVERLRGERDA